MADSNDELLEDGDLSETNFEELDLAEEDALLADDDEKPARINDNTGDGAVQEDDDYLELGLEEDILMHDEEVLENGNSARKPIEIDFNYNDDSDDNSGGERSRFKSERQITNTSLTRNTSSIPETLDAVALRIPVKFNNKGGNNRGGGKPGRGGVGGNQWGQYRNFGRNPNIHVNPHFRPRLPMGGPPHMWNGGFQGHPQAPFPPHIPPYGGGFQPMQPSQWNDPGYFNAPPGHPQYHQPPMDNYYGPQDNYYPHQPNFHHQNLPSQPQMGWADDFYPGPHNFPSSHFSPSTGPPMGPPRMRPPFNSGPKPFAKPQNKPFQGKLQSNQGNQNNSGGNLARPQKREFFLYTQNNKAPPVKQQKFDSSANRVRSNLQEVKIVDALPPEVIVEEEDEEMKDYLKKIEEQKRIREKILREKEEKRKVAAQQKAQESAGAQASAQVATAKPKPPQPSNDGPPGVVDGPVFKTVRLRKADGKTVIRKLPISEIKKLKKVPVGKKGVALKTASPKGTPVRVVAKGTTVKAVVPKSTPPKPGGLATTEVKKLNKVPLAIKAAPPNSCGTPSRVVAVENLSASTSQKQLEVLASKIGIVEKVELDSNKNTAIIKFSQLQSAQTFVSKYQRKMVDLSMIGVKFIKEE